MDVTWSDSTDDGLIRGEVDGHRFELSGEGSYREFSFGEWALGCSWHVRRPDDPASLDGWGQVDPVDELLVLRGSVPTVAVDVVTVQGDERSRAILLADDETGRRGWVGFARSTGPPTQLEWTEPGGSIMQMPLLSGRRTPGGEAK